MKLWTWHKPDFSLLDGHVDRKKSEYIETVPGYDIASRELASRLGTSQFVWCFTLPDRWIVTPGQTEVEWVLDVPCKAILKFVDDIVWNRILGEECILPGTMRDEFWDQALQRFPDDADAREQFVKEREESFWAKPPPSGDWWDCLFTQDHAGEYVSALVPHPCQLDWVVVNPRPEG